jgi:hypothetical protein
MPLGRAVTSTVFDKSPMERAVPRPSEEKLLLPQQLQQLGDVHGNQAAPYHGGKKKRPLA